MSRDVTTSETASESGHEAGSCELCGRAVAELTRHHLIPQARHRKARNRRLFDREDVKTRIALLCRPCHSNIHAHIDTKSLEAAYNTVESLRAHPDVARFTAWIRDKDPGLKVAFRRGRRR